MTITLATLIKWIVVFITLVIAGNFFLDWFWQINDLIPSTTV